ncbi:MAG: protein TolQ [Blastochloris viridis]|uniref:Protein TolQ n=1 Tax=Blastochloris viridis TaxID=1079 RepID=A0A6N4REJ1_BLAVI|nr:MAG: protein TolQ [Blastochloris viridis]
MEPTAVAASVDMTFWGLFLQAGIFVKLIMLGLFAASVTVWAVWFSKGKQFKALHRKADDFEDIFWSGSHTLESFVRQVNPQQGDHPLASVFVVGLEEWNAANDEERRDGTALQRVRRMMDATARRELEALEAWLPFLATTGSVGPFVGLLGTVWGIMTSFQHIGASKNTSLAVVAPGIAEALFATAIGLFAAIPAVVAYNRLTGSMGRYAARVETFIDEFLTVLERQSTRKTTARR